MVRQSERENKIDGNTFHRSLIRIGAKKFFILPHFHLSFFYKYEKHRSKIPLNIDNGKLDDFTLKVERKWGEYLFFNAYYKYKKYKAQGGSKDRDFHDNAIGSGLSFNF